MRRHGLRLADFAGMAMLAGNICLPVCSSGATNAVWYREVCSSNIVLSGLTAQEACRSLENMSRRIDPEQRGVRIVYSLSPFAAGQEPRIKEVKFQKASLLDLLHLCTSVTGLRCVVTEDIALVTRWRCAYLMSVLHGKCVDAETKAPITNVTLRCGPLDPVLAVSADGTYMCGIPHRWDFSVSDDIWVLDPEVFEEEQNISVSAPGYQSRTYSKRVLEDMRSGYRVLDIELLRDEDCLSAPSAEAMGQRQITPERPTEASSHAGQ